MAKPRLIFRTAARGIGRDKVNSRNTLPGAAAFNIGDGASTNAVFRGQLKWAFTEKQPSLDLTHIRRGEFLHPTPAALCNHIGNVIALRPKEEVRGIYAAGIVARMAREQIGWIVGGVKHPR